MKRSIITWICCLIFTLSSTAQVTNIPSKEADTVRLLSYNVHNFVGMDGQRDYQRTADVINEIAPDVVAVQEADSATRRSNNAYTLQEVAARTQMIPTYAAAIEYQGGKYGIGLLSHEPPLQVKRYALPGSEEARTLMVAEFTDYVVAVTHFSLTAEDRQASVSIIEEAVKGIRKPLFLMGDMNCTPSSPTQQALQKNFRTLNDTTQVTFEGKTRGDCIDYIYQYKNDAPPVKVLHREVIKDEMTSDHYPLYVDVSLRSN
jgi:endonuclease/exonuclease/phosphatase family metal-dependent hydrolase